MYAVLCIKLPVSSLLANEGAPGFIANAWQIEKFWGVFGLQRLSIKRWQLSFRERLKRRVGPRRRVRYTVSAGMTVAQSASKACSSVLLPVFTRRSALE